MTWGVRFGGRGEKCSLSLNRSRRTVPIPVPGRALNSNSGMDENSPRPPDPAQAKEEKPTTAPSQDPWLVLDIWVYSHVTDEETGSGICHVLDSATFTPSPPITMGDAVVTNSSKGATSFIKCLLCTRCCVKN